MSRGGGDKKWSMPHFEYHGIMLGMAAFKEHCSIGFWKGELIMGKRAGSDGGMGHFGRVASLKDLPPDRHFIEYVRKAADLKPKSARRELTIPEYFRTALRRKRKLRLPSTDLVTPIRRNTSSGSLKRSEKKLARNGYRR